MKFDSRQPVAVFLGPSLPLAEAQEILPANYFPPVRHGQIYRLLASGVRRIIVIDGVFHNDVPVWHRELLDALEHGIEVFGASSMGALRAAELAPYGMIGHGTIYDWYDQGIIDGDDEVALLHAEASHAFLALSEPLVNIRATLDAAVDAGVATAPERDALVASAKSLCFTERSMPRLQRDAQTIVAPERLDALSRFLSERRVDLKRLDAVSVLEACASRPLASSASRPEFDRRPAKQYVFQAAADRGYLTDGSLIRGEALLDALLSDKSHLGALPFEAIRDFYIDRWAEARGLRCPDDVLEAAQAKPASDEWLARNGLVRAEHEESIRREARIEWILDQRPDAFGFDATPEADEAGLEPTYSILMAWADEHGIRHPEPASPREALDWLIDKTPTHFGFTWSIEAAVLRKLQVRGLSADLITRLEVR